MHSATSGLDAKANTGFSTFQSGWIRTSYYQAIEDVSKENELPPAEEDVCYSVQCKRWAIARYTIGGTSVLRVREIKALSNDQYEVVLADDGGAQTVVCRIVKDGEIIGITMDPDILWSAKKAACSNQRSGNHSE